LFVAVSCISTASSLGSFVFYQNLRVLCSGLVFAPHTIFTLEVALSVRYQNNSYFSGYLSVFLDG